MQNDYHIYIHANGTGSKTTPYQNQVDEEGKPKDSTFSPETKQMFGIAKQVASQGIISTGASALSKVAPWVAAVVIAAKVTDKVLSTGFAHQEEYTGNYRNNVNYNNFKSSLEIVMHPAKTGYALIKQQFQIDKHNIAIQQQNRLIGNSILKDMKAGF